MSESTTRHHAVWLPNGIIIGSVVEYPSGRITAYLFGGADGGRRYRELGSWKTFPVSYARGKILYHYRTRHINSRPITRGDSL